jgi:hypothetical protein
MTVDEIFVSVQLDIVIKLLEAAERRTHVDPSAIDQAIQTLGHLKADLSWVQRLS